MADDVLSILNFIRRGRQQGAAFRREQNIRKNVQGEEANIATLLESAPGSGRGEEAPDFVGPLQTLGVRKERLNEDLERSAANIVNIREGKSLGQGSVDRVKKFLKPPTVAGVEGRVLENVERTGVKSLKTGEREVFDVRFTQGARAATDTAAFVSRASEQAIIDTGKPLSPRDQNKAALQFRRAQVAEVSQNRLASRSVDINTEGKIKFNAEKGKQLALIKTSADLNAARGIQTPLGKIKQAKGRMEGNLATLARHYTDLDSMGAIVNVDRSTMENIFASAGASAVGQSFGRITGSRAQSVRNSIKKLKPLIIQDIRQSTDMGARGLDSEKELEFYLQAATDEKTDIQSNIAAIIVLDEAFGNGNIAKQLKGLTNPSAIKKISQRGNDILNQRVSIEQAKQPKTQTVDGDFETPQKAPDGNFYIRRDGVFLKVEE